MATLFEPTKLNNIALKNRLVRSAAWLGFSSEEYVTMRLRIESFRKGRPTISPYAAR